MRAVLFETVVIASLASGCAKPAEPEFSHPYPLDEPVRPDVDRSGIGVFFDLLHECSKELDAGVLFYVRHELCARPDDPGAADTAQVLERCRSKRMAGGTLETEGQFAALAAPLDLQACPPPPPVLADLEPSTWSGSESETVTVVLSNLCACELEFGFTLLGDPMTQVRKLPPLSRQRITIPRGFGLQARHPGASFGAWCGTESAGGQVWIPWHGDGCGASDEPEIPPGSW